MQLLGCFSGSKQLQFLQLILSVAVLCLINIPTLFGAYNRFCLQRHLNCVINGTNGIIYPPIIFQPVCAKSNRTCRLFENKCDFVTENCKREVWIQDNKERCANIEVGESGTCNCPGTAGCETGTNICARLGGFCKLFEDDCELKTAQCLDGDWSKTNAYLCCGFKENARGFCKMNGLAPVCATKDYKTCRYFSTSCEMLLENRNSTEKWIERSYRHCRCLHVGSFGPCLCGERS